MSVDSRRFVNGLPTWLIGVTLVVPILLGVLGWTLPIRMSIGNTRLFLSALAGAQASVLAIVFSVTLLGIQIATTRYASRMVPLFVRAPIFKFTFGVFILSISVDFVQLYSLSSKATRADIAGVFVAGGFAIVAAVSLAAFIPNILARSTPDGLIKAFESSLQPSVYLRRTRDYQQSGERADHPLQPLHSLIMSAISSREWATAERGLNGFETIGKRTIETLVLSGDLPRQIQTQEARALFDIALKEYLSEITIHAFENDESELVGQAINVQGQIAQTAVENHRRFIADQAVRGIANSVQEAPPTIEGNTIRQPAFQQFDQLLRAVTEHPDPRYIWNILETVNHQINILFRKDADRSIYQGLLLTYFGGTLPRIHATLLDYYGGYLSELEVEWRDTFAPDELANRQFLEAWFKWREVFVNTSTWIIRYRARHEDYPMTYGNFFTAWKDVCKNAAESEATDYAIVLCELFIESAYNGALVDEESYTTWIARLSSICQADIDVVRNAFDELKAEGPTGQVRGPVYQQQFGRKPETVREIVRESLSESKPEFDEWLETFEKDVYSDYREHSR